MPPRQRTLDDTGLPVAPSWKLSPSDFAFLWEECKRCFWLKVRAGHARPGMPMPGIFSKIDSAMKDRFMGRRTDEFPLGMPAGEFRFAGKWVESAPLRVPGVEASCYVRGAFDTVVALDGGGFAVIDFKTSSPKASTTPLYARQLHAYAWALERAVPGKFALAPVTQLGLLVFEPQAFHCLDEGVRYEGGITWVPLARDDAMFERFLRDVLTVIAREEPPEPAEACAWCRYRATVREMPH